MVAVLKNVHDFLKTNVFSIANESNLEPRERLEKMLLKLGTALLSHEGGCIVGNTTLEVAGQNVVFKGILKDIFEDWRLAMKSILKEEFSEGTAGRMAEQSVMEFEGAVMLGQIYETDQYIKDVFVRTLTKMR